MDAPERMPGDAEAAGAAAAMQELAGRTPHAIGDALWFQACAGAMPRQGRVIGYGVGDLIEVEDQAGQRHAIRPWQIAEF